MLPNRHRSWFLLDSFYALLVVLVDNGGMLWMAVVIGLFAFVLCLVLVTQLVVCHLVLVVVMA